MTTSVSAAMTVARAVLAVALSLSWLLLAGTPASALIPPGGERVEKPKQGAVIKVAKPLIVAVDRIGEEEVALHTRLFYGGTPAPPDPEEPPPEEGEEEPPPEEGEEEPPPAELKRVSKKVIALPLLTKPAENPMRFGAERAIDPYGLVWLPKPGVAPNGQYTLEFRAVSEADPDRQWQRYEFRLDAPPPATSAPGIAVADAAAKRLSIAWQAHPVPDLSHYTVERQLDGGDWKVAEAEVDPQTTQIDDVVGKYGSYRYRVTAVRPAGDGSDEMRSTVSPLSGSIDLLAPGSAPPDDPTGDGDNGDGTGDDGDVTSPDGTDTTAPPPLSPGTTTDPGLSSADESSVPDFDPPAGFEETYEGPLDYDVAQNEVTERVPVDIAQGGADDSDTIQVLDRAIDQSQVLPPVAGGLILVVAAGHVFRYLHE